MDDAEKRNIANILGSSDDGVDPNPDGKPSAFLSEAEHNALSDILGEPSDDLDKDKDVDDKDKYDKDKKDDKDKDTRNRVFCANTNLRRCGMEAYSLDLRRRVKSDFNAGMKSEDVAEKYEVSSSWVRRLRQRWRETGSIERLPRNAGRPLKITGTREERLKKLESLSGIVAPKDELREQRKKFEKEFSRGGGI